MPSYKLTYFDCRGFAEVSRMLLHLGKIPFEDVRIPREDWPAIKQNFPFQQVPVLEVDGKVIPQSIAIARYLARLTGYAGKDDIELALVDGLVDQYKDYFDEGRPFFMSHFKIIYESEEKHAEAKNNFLEARTRFLSFLTNYLKASNTGYLAGGGLTYADLVIIDNTITNLDIVPEYLDGFPEVRAHFEKITSIPEVKDYLAKRPARPY